MKYVKIKLVIGVLIVQMTFSSCFKQIALNSLGIFEKKYQQNI